MIFKKILFIVIAGFFTVNAQVLQWEPLFATVEDTITIIYDASEGNGALLNVFPIWAHTGVITDSSTAPNDWRYVKTDWGQNTPETQMTSLGGSLWQISFHIRSYYGIPQDENVLELAFVFRNSDGSIVGRMADGGDIFLPLSQPGLNVTILSPTEIPFFPELNDTVHFMSVSSPEAVSTTLYEDGIEVFSTTEDTLEYSTIADSYGKTKLVVTAEDMSGATSSDSLYYIVRAPVTIAALPPGLEQGINYTSSTEAALVLYAPEKDFVYAVGDFSNWEFADEYYMKKTPDGSTWWIEIDNLTPQTPYRYQYSVGEELRIADPYTELVLDPWNDTYIDSTRFPDLIPYPAGYTSQPVGILMTGETDYQWQVTDFDRPAKEDLVIYEMLIRDFTEEQTFQSVIDTLNYLVELGVNAIELMPVNEFEGNLSWGYNPAFYFAVDKYYGTKDKLKELIDLCHEQGVAVIIDMVLNHSFGSSPMVRLYWDAANNRPAANNPWFNPVARHPYNVGYDFNHESAATKYFVDRVNRFWLEEFKVDGFRYDLSKGFTQFNSGGNVGLWGQYDQSRIDLLERMADEVWEYDSTAYVILEHFADNNEETVLSNYGMMLWGNFNYNYNEATMGYHDNNQSNFSGMSYVLKGWNDPHLVGYMESHDEERLMFKNLEYGNSDGSYNITELPIALQRMKMAGSFFFTIPGPKMVWQFGELGYDYSINWPSGTPADRLTPKPPRWDYYDITIRRYLYKTWQALINLKKNYEAFRTDDFSLNVGGAMKRIQLNGDSMHVTIIGNFDVVSGDINPFFQDTGTWYDFFSGDSIEVSNSGAPITLEPGEFHIYTDVKLPAPDPDIINDIHEVDHQGVIESYRLEQNYPNPFNPSTVIRFSIKERGSVKLKIYDITGKEVAVIIDKELEAGIYETPFHSALIEGSLSSGIYFYRLQAGGFIDTKKMLLLK